MGCFIGLQNMSVRCKTHCTLKEFVRLAGGDDMVWLHLGALPLQIVVLVFGFNAAGALHQQGHGPLRQLAGAKSDGPREAVGRCRVVRVDVKAGGGRGSGREWWGG
eukprot:6200252-Pleurochrysis_carterae.AAC.2